MFRKAAIWTTYVLLQALVLLAVIVLVLAGSAAPRSELVATLGGLVVLLGIHLGVFRVEIRSLWVDHLGVPIDGAGVLLAIAGVLVVLGASLIISGLSLNL
jgi:hypothetical protein